MPGLACLTAAATPDSSPPPPTPATTTVTSGRSVEDLQARAALARDDIRIVEGRHVYRAPLRQYLLQPLIRSRPRRRRTAPPWRRMPRAASALAREAPSGMTTVTGVPAAAAAYATAAAWLPADIDDDAPRTLVGGHVEHPVDGAPGLEGARDLQVLRLEEDPGRSAAPGAGSPPGRSGTFPPPSWTPCSWATSCRGPGMEHRGARDAPPDACRGGLDGGQRHVARSGGRRVVHAGSVGRAWWGRSGHGAARSRTGLAGHRRRGMLACLRKH